MWSTKSYLFTAIMTRGTFASASSVGIQDGKTPHTYSRTLLPDEL